jgi:hypothetical protein
LGVLQAAKLVLRVLLKDFKNLNHVCFAPKHFLSGHLMILFHILSDQTWDVCRLFIEISDYLIIFADLVSVYQGVKQSLHMGLVPASNMILFGRCLESEYIFPVSLFVDTDLLHVELRDFADLLFIVVVVVIEVVLGQTKMFLFPTLGFPGCHVKIALTLYVRWFLCCKCVVSLEKAVWAILVLV